MNKTRAAHITNTERKFDGFFKLDELTIDVTRHDGEHMTLKRLLLERGHAAAILMYDPAIDSVVLISEMRPGPLAVGDDPFTLSVVAGMIDPGEDSLKTIKRESPEETGLEIGKTYLIHPGLYVSPGGTSEKIALYCAIVDSTKAKPFAGLAKEGEDIKTHIVPFNEFIRMIDTYAINDMKTATAGYWLLRDPQGLRKAFTSAPKQILEL